MLRVEIGQILQFRQSIRCTPLIPERHFGFWAKHLAANGWVVPDRAHPRDPALNDDEWLLDAMTRAMDKVLKKGWTSGSATLGRQWGRVKAGNDADGALWNGARDPTASPWVARWHRRLPFQM